MIDFMLLMTKIFGGLLFVVALSAIFLAIIYIPIYLYKRGIPPNISHLWHHSFALEHEESVPPQELNNIQKSLILSTDPSRYLKAINGFTFKIYKCKYCNASKIEEGKYNK